MSLSRRSFPKAALDAHVERAVAKATQGTGIDRVRVRYGGFNVVTDETIPPGVVVLQPPHRNGPITDRAYAIITNVGTGRDDDAALAP